RVVSMPSTDVFDRQDADYRESVLPNAVRKRVAVEAGITGFWRQYVGLAGAVVGIDRLGASAPCGELFEHLGFTAEAIVEAAKALWSIWRRGRSPDLRRCAVERSKLRSTERSPAAREPPVTGRACCRRGSAVIRARRPARPTRPA